VCGLGWGGRLGKFGEHCVEPLQGVDAVGDGVRVVLELSVGQVDLILFDGGDDLGFCHKRKRVKD
jgi:hypothetical protein